LVYKVDGLAFSQLAVFAILCFSSSHVFVFQVLVFSCLWMVEIVSALCRLSHSSSQLHQALSQVTKYVLFERTSRFTSLWTLPPEQICCSCFPFPETFSLFSSKRLEFYPQSNSIRERDGSLEFFLSCFSVHFPGIFFKYIFKFTFELLECSTLSTTQM
jgi:hypothetical protein